MSHTLLIIEDEADIRLLLEYQLQQEGYLVYSCKDAQDAQTWLKKNSPQLILLDLMLPDMSGLKLCQIIKQTPATQTIPVLMLTAKNEDRDRIIGFEAGADDYLQKPFNMRELSLRIQAILKRTQTTIVSPPHFEHFFLRIEKDTHRVFVEHQQIELTALEFKLLWTLCQRIDKVWTRAELLDVVWGIKAAIDTRTVDTHVKRLREKIGGAAQFIETVRGIGYKFVYQPSDTDTP